MERQEHERSGYFYINNDFEADYCPLFYILYMFPLYLSTKKYTIVLDLGISY